MNKYTCSNGERVSEATIKQRLSKVYREMYEGEGPQMCHGCGGRAEASAHILPKARAKQLHLTELIWSSENIFPACNSCNALAENVASDSILDLLNYERIREVLQKYDPERASKLPNFKP
jgi:hypothetical protein